MTSYFDWAAARGVKPVQSDVAPGHVPPLADPLATTIRAALDANALGMTVEEVAPEETGDETGDLVFCTDGVERCRMKALGNWRDHESTVPWETSRYSK